MEEGGNQIDFLSRCSAIILEQSENYVSAESSNDRFCGKDLFEEFREENRYCHWNPHLLESINGIHFKGIIEPHTLLISGRNIYLDTIRNAWSRRVLNAPKNYDILSVGEINDVKICIAPQAQFTPLPEALCLIISELNRLHIQATLTKVGEKLQEKFSNLDQPSEQMVYGVLGILIEEHKLMLVDGGYRIVTPDLYKHERIYNDEEIYQARSCPSSQIYIPFQGKNCYETVSISCQTEPVENIYSKCQDEKAKSKIEGNYGIRESVREKKKKDKNRETPPPPPLNRTSSVTSFQSNLKALPEENIYMNSMEVLESKSKGGKNSLLSKIFQRGRKTPSIPNEKEVQYATFSAQFPPPDMNFLDNVKIPSHLFSSDAISGRSTPRLHGSKRDIHKKRNRFSLALPSDGRYYDVSSNSLNSSFDVFRNGHQVYATNKSYGDMPSMYDHRKTEMIPVRMGERRSKSIPRQYLVEKMKYDVPKCYNNNNTYCELDSVSVVLKEEKRTNRSQESSKGFAVDHYNDEHGNSKSRTPRKDERKFSLQPANGNYLYMDSRRNSSEMILQTSSGRNTPILSCKNELYAISYSSDEKNMNCLGMPLSPKDAHRQKENTSKVTSPNSNDTPYHPQHFDNNNHPCNGNWDSGFSSPKYEINSDNVDNESCVSESTFVSPMCYINSKQSRNPYVVKDSNGPYMKSDLKSHEHLSDSVDSVILMCSDIYPSSLNNSTRNFPVEKSFQSQSSSSQQTVIENVGMQNSSPYRDNTTNNQNSKKQYTFTDGDPQVYTPVVKRIPFDKVDKNNHDSRLNYSNQNGYNEQIYSDNNNSHHFHNTSNTSVGHSKGDQRSKNKNYHQNSITNHHSAAPGN